MSIQFIAMTPADTGDVVTFLSNNRFPFHVQAAPEARDIHKSIEDGRFWNADAQGYWVMDKGIRIGLAALEDLQDEGAPLFDLRLAEAFRGKGIGLTVLRALCDKVFKSMPEALRLEGQTREDNIAMRKTFIRAGFLKEAHYRLAWPTNDGGHVASIAYAILRQDWESGTVTEFEWEDIRL